MSSAGVRRVGLRSLQPSSLSGFGWPGCKSACAVHYPPILDQESPLGPRMVEKLSSRSRIFASPPKPDRLLATGGLAARGSALDIASACLKALHRAALAAHRFPL
jgi:hypothetical protein